MAEPTPAPWQRNGHYLETVDEPHLTIEHNLIAGLISLGMTESQARGELQTYAAAKVREAQAEQEGKHTTSCYGLADFEREGLQAEIAGLESQLADPLAMLEALASQFGWPISIGAFWMNSYGDIRIKGVGYTREETAALLAGNLEPVPEECGEWPKETPCPKN
jgi:hypothetical protein